MSIQSEIPDLFPQHIIRRATRLEPERVDALAVNKAAGALLRLKGQPTEQAALVNTMHSSTAAALCRWLIDPAFWGMVGGITKQ